MDYRKFGNTYVVRLDRGEEITEKLLWLASTEHIRLAQVSGLGEVNILTLGNYSPETRQYKVSTFHADFEIVALSGNLTRKDDKPYLHIHMAASDASGRCYGGHLHRGDVNGSAELFVTVIDGEAVRESSAEIGLNLLRFKD